MNRNTHRCPAPGCTVVISNRIFACRPHWYALSKPVREAIKATAGLTIFDPARRAAIQSAWEEWR
jgi:hypothetical protein